MGVIFIFLPIVALSFLFVYFVILSPERKTHRVVKWEKVNSPEALIRDARKRFSEDNRNYRMRSGRRRWW